MLTKCILEGLFLNINIMLMQLQCYFIRYKNLKKKNFEKKTRIGR